MRVTDTNLHILLHVLQSDTQFLFLTLSLLLLALSLFLSLSLSLTCIQSDWSYVVMFRFFHDRNSQIHVMSDLGLEFSQTRFHRQELCQVLTAILLPDDVVVRELLQGCKRMYARNDDDDDDDDNDDDE